MIILTHIGNLAKALVQQYPIPHFLWFWTLLPQTLDVVVKWIGVPMWIWTLLLWHKLPFWWYWMLLQRQLYINDAMDTVPSED